MVDDGIPTMQWLVLGSTSVEEPALEGKKYNGRIKRAIIYPCPLTATACVHQG